MEIHELQANTLVEHPDWGLGEIIEDKGAHLLINFPNHIENSEQRMSKSLALVTLKALPTDGFESYFHSDSDQVRAWVYGGQLRLIGTALADEGGECTLKSLGLRLEERVLMPMGTTWKTWWDKARGPAKASGYFSIQQSKPVKLLARISDIPVEPVFSAPRVRSRPSNSPSKLNAIDQLNQQRNAHMVDLRLQRQNHAEELRSQRDHYISELRIQRESHAADLEQQREIHAVDLLRLRSQVEEREKQIEGLREYIATSREESRLDIRRGMLEVMADTLRTLQKSSINPAADILRDTKAGIEIALQAGGVEWFGELKDEVEFDPRMYEGDEDLMPGDTVRIVERGAKVPGNRTGDFILIKAQVKR